MKLFPSRFRTWLDDHPRLKRYGTVILVCFVLFELSQMLLGAYIGINIALHGF